MRGVGLLWLLVALSGCHPDRRERDAGARLDGQQAPECEDYHCYGEVRCWNGSASASANDAIPCREWTGQCPSLTVSCIDGCDLPVSMPYEFGDDWWNNERLMVLCAETPAAQVGDPCAGDCLPTRAVADETGAVTQTYLACEAGGCVATAAPVIEGYLAPCADTAAEHGGPGVSGFAHAFPADANPDAGADAAALCLLAWDQAAQATRHGLTAACLGDWDCPEGASCDAVAPLPADPYARTAVCRPGARGAPLVEHLPARS